jgi:hypothetical protein
MPKSSNASLITSLTSLSDLRLVICLVPLTTCLPSESTILRYLIVQIEKIIRYSYFEMYNTLM